MARYDQIGSNYASRRGEDPVLRDRIWAAISGAETVVNVGAGAGSYEPRDLDVTAVEPSAVMAAQRIAERPAIRADATDLPLHDASVDAAMTVLSLHDWHPNQRRGVRELCRVARKSVVIVTIDPTVSGKMWLMADYLTEVRDLDHEIFPSPEVVAAWLDCDATVEVIPVSRDTPDHSLLSFWAHPERVLDPAARAATSGFARQPPEVVNRVVEAVRTDLESCAWDSAHGNLRGLDTFDAGLRIIHGRLS